MRRFAVLFVALATSAVACEKKPETPPPPAPEASVQDASESARSRDAAREASASDASGTDASAEPDGSTSSTTVGNAGRYGTFKLASRVGCSALAKGSGARWVSNRDLLGSFVDGDDLLALVNRSPQGSLPPDYAPHDMVDIVRFEPRTAAECDRWQCLRKEAAMAMKPLLAAMAKQGFPSHIDSVYRSYASQCVTFKGWAGRSDFCSATEQSALPGHSQHQLGTTIDLFTQEWKAGGETVFRQGFGCTKAGKWLKEHSWEYGYVFPYPIHPDDLHEKEDCISRGDHEVPINPKTGYRYEHWHVRYIGIENAKELHEAYLASDPKSPDAVTLEQWIRKKRGITGDADMPVCDGCNCGACSTLSGETSACGDRAMSIAESGSQDVTNDAPKLLAVRRATATEAGKWAGPVLAVDVDVPAHTLSQPPFLSVTGPGYGETSTTVSAFVPLPATRPRAYPAIAKAVRIVARPKGATEFSWAAGMADPLVGRIYNRANLVVPSPSGKRTYFVPLPKATGDIEVGLSVGGEKPSDLRALSLSN
jgi:D-alanyl-D-alanine carboxypeptidase